AEALGNGAEGTAVGSIPVKAVATEAQDDLIRLGPIAWLAAPDGEQAQEHAFVSDGIEIVKLALGSQVLPFGIEAVGADPEPRFAGFPARAGFDLPVLDIAACPPQPAVVGANAVD